MRVVCESCHARYQIPDERVAGRTLKIRCRKCGEKITVRGDAETVAAPTDLATSQGSVEWYVSEGGDQRGPLSTEQLLGALRAGELLWEAYVWHEGLDDWSPASDIDELVYATASPRLDGRRSTPDPAPALPPEADDDAPTRMFQGGAAPRAAGPNFNWQGGHDDDPDTTTHPQATRPLVDPVAADRAPSAAWSTNPPSNPAPNPPADAPLFSVSNLKDFGSGSESEALPTGHAQAEGSGIIDIRKLAAMARQSAAPPGDTTRANDEALIELGSAGAFGAMNSLQPTSTETGRTGVVIAIIAGFGMLAVAAFAAIWITRGPGAALPSAPLAVTAPTSPSPAQAPEPAAPAAAPAEPARPPTAPTEPEPTEAKPTEAKQPPSAPPPRKPSATAQPSAPSDPKPAATPPSKPKPAPDKPAAEPPKPKPKAEPEATDEIPLKDTPTAPQAPATAAPAAAPAEPAKPKTIDQLLDDAVPGENGAASAEANLPETPSRDDVQRVMKKIEPAVRKCGEGESLRGVALVEIGVRGDTGRVGRVRVTGIQGPAGSCMALAVRKAVFPKFRQELFSVTYPYKFE